MTRVGIMQGRLLPPVDGQLQAFPVNGWEREFELARRAGVEAIEWIYDFTEERENPLAADEGVRRTGELIERTGIAVNSCCADYFMRYPILRASDGQMRERLEHLTWLLRRCKALGAGHVVLPFVDRSAITSDGELRSVADSLGQSLPAIERSGVEVHLETSLGPNAFQQLLALVPHEMIKVNYDIGNSASLGYLPEQELDAYGERVGSVHVKDRRRGGDSVPLGSGDANFLSVFGALRKRQYDGDFILQAARGPAGSEVAWAVANREFVHRWWTRAA